MIKLDNAGFKITALKRVGITPIVEKMMETRLRRFGHVERRCVDFVLRRVN